MIWQTLGGIGLFLLGMTLMTDGLKALAGPALRAVLSRFISGPISGIGWGAGITALVQSSSATTITTIGFASAGLLTFPQAIGVIFGANLGTTSTSWIVALLGFEFSISRYVEPLIFIGVLCKLLAKDRLAALGMTLAGFGVLFVGLAALQEGMSGLSEHVTPASFPPATLLGIFGLVGIGVVMTVVLQSSSAAVAMTLAALHTGTINLDQAAGLVIGQNVGTCVKAALIAIGAPTAGRRTAFAHIGFNVITALLALPMIPVMVRVADWATQNIQGGADTVALATFHTVFNVVGVLVLLPLIGPFSRLIERLAPAGEMPEIDRLDPALADVPGVALDAVRTTLGATTVALGAGIHARLTQHGRTPPRVLEQARAAVDRSRSVLAAIGTQPASSHDVAEQTSLVHALDHIESLIDAAAEPTPVHTRLTGPHGTGAHAKLTEALTLAHDPLHADPDRAGAMSREIAEQRRNGRAGAIEQAAQGVITPHTSAERIEALRWCDRVAYHLWRSIAHLSRQQPEAAAQREPNASES
ncbi:MAG: Na/Pi cotransporter family protein [Phycisphaerales bacterium]|nr:MAG: Na/Pi cotransporter family protein [Phycisphaerales bacterium]